MTTRLFTCAVALWLVAAAGSSLPAQDAYPWHLPTGFPPPPVPADNPMSAAKVELGRHLFYDRRLSANGTQSCSTCHEQARAFADARGHGLGSTGQLHPRGSMSLVNVAYAATLTWANPLQTRLEDQVLVPMYGDHPVELGLGRDDQWLATLVRDATYQRLFAAAFGAPTSITRDQVSKALASFERSIVSARSPYDRYHYDRDESAISDAAKRGEILFHSRPLSCFTCHGGPHFSSAMGVRRSNPVEFHNTGLYNLPGMLSYPASDTGLYEVTHDVTDIGKFKAPTLRNIAVTAPYMHDGSAATLDDVIDHYAAGGRTIAAGPDRGVGHNQPNKSPSIRGFAITLDQRADLIAFLQSLTDEALLHDRAFANPWVTPSK
ncbi:MAG: MbnH family di-heme enzyme [Acidobacteriota bacterium]